MILIGLGANLASEKYGSPQQTLEAAIAAMPQYGIHVIKKSRWHQTEPVPKSDQPMFTNGVIAVETELTPYQLLDALRQIENDFGRIRNGVRNEARCIDLDLLTYNHERINDPPRLELPHPRMLERPFVMQPLLEVTLEWRLAG
ncbi:MAG: 2-amino-4-hydroxy-6-hydroxymethyldihydropteridine diphosphokinase [Alphaproteobacteria bacterium]|nr:MAG: 2-amino-4-hydroxy-6-hydroxymethyldihydropteridine diphosphokinase [Alphaproteobacteria bacterium]